MTNSATATIDPVEGGQAQARRKRGLITLAVIVLLGGLLWFLYAWLFSADRVSTDNAYVGAETAQVTPLVNGAVTSIKVRETETVKAGQVLLTIDPTDARIALATAQAELARAVRQIQQTTAQGQSLAAQVQASGAGTIQAEARAAKARGDVAQARIDLARRERLAPAGAVSGEELTAARHALQTAQAELREAEAARAEAAASRQAAIQTRRSNELLVAGPIDDNPEVAAARTRVQAARLELDRTVVRAPVAGVVARRAVQLGQRVQVGTPLMSIVPIQTAYVDANFKEVQLDGVAPGMPVTLTSDFYGDDVVFHGRVTGFAGGTGSAFALVPSQNATGNWIKIVQRLPVRIALDPAELRRHPLRVGLSMNATIDVSQR